MANSILAKLGFSVDKHSVTGAVGGINSIGKAVSGLQTKMKQAFALAGVQSFATGIKSLGASIKDTFAKSFTMAQEFAATVDKIAKTSRMVGLSVKDYQAFASAAQHAGMSTEEMDSALKKFNVNLGKARAGDKTSLKMFDAILGGKNLSNYKDSTALIKDIADGYAKLSTAEQKAFVSQELFGKSGLKMSELLSGGKENISQLIADFEAHGGGFSEEGAARAEEFNDELQNLRETVNSLKTSVMEELFPVFIDLFKTVGEFVKGNRKELMPMVKEVFGTVTDLIKSLLPKIPAILKTVLSIVEFIGPKWGLIVAGVASMLPNLAMIVFGLIQIVPILGKIFGVVKMIAFGAVGAVVAKIGLVVAGVLSVYKIFTDIHKNWEMFSSFIEEKLNSATGITYTLWSVLKSIVGQFEMTYRFVGLIFGGWNEWSAFVKKDLGDVNYIVDLIGDCLAGVMYGLYEAFGWVSKKLESIGGFLSKIPFIGKIFGGSINFDSVKDIGSEFADSQTASVPATLGATAAQAVSESRTTVTNRFAVDFKNMPRGVQVTPPEQGDFDWSRGYTLGGI